MSNDKTAKAEVEFRVSKLKRLYYWLSYQRFTGALYGGLLFVPWLLILVVLIALAVVFAPYMLFVLYKQGKRGWLIFFVFLIGVPVGMAFVSTGSEPFDAFLDFMPLLAFYFYCYLLRFSVREWISDASMAAGMLISRDR